MAEVLPTGTFGITNGLYFLMTEENFKPPASAKFLYFSSESTLVYTAFFADFGPLNLGLVCTFCHSLSDVISSASKSGKQVVYYATSPHHRSNSAVLICAYLIFVLGFSAEQAYAPFMGREPLVPFRDAAFCLNTFPLFVIDCVRAIGKAVALGHVNYKTFNPQAFKTLAQLEHGDISWVIPDKFIAFSGPLAKRRSLGPGVYSLLPEEYVPIFKQLGVSCIVRFNNKCYDKNVFERAGIKHVDLFYEDGGNPTEAILQSFLKLCENEGGAIAVHCKAGLGRTGTNIVAYMVKHYGYSCREAIAWHRLCRPGAVVGPQQQYLMSIEQKLVLEGEQYRARLNQSSTQSSARKAGGDRGRCDPSSRPQSGSASSELNSGIVGTSTGQGILPSSPQPERVRTASNCGIRGGNRQLFPHAGSSGSSPQQSSPVVSLPIAMGVRTDRESVRREREDRRKERQMMQS